MKITLVGYMTSGKSSVGKLLAQHTHTKYIDLDDFIEEKEQKSITDIFKDAGELYFRKKEIIYLKELLEQDDDLCIATGGGTPCYGNNMELIVQNSQSVYLKTSINEIHKRLCLSRNKRPLVANLSDEQLIEFIGKHLFERTPFYQKASITVLTDRKSSDEVATSILKCLSEFDS